MKTRFIYRIHPEGSIRPLVSGSGRIASSDFAAIVCDIMARHNVKATQELHGPESIMAGAVFRTRFHYQGQAVTLVICPLPEDFGPFVSAAILNAGAEKPAADLAPKAPAGLLKLWGQDATAIAADLAKRAIAAALAEEGGQAFRIYWLESGKMYCRATYDGESIVTAWDIEGRPLSRASAETMIAGRLASRFDQGKGLK